MKTKTIDPTLDNIRFEIEAYGRRNQYDVSYMLHMLEHHPEALKLFQNVIPLAHCRLEAPLDVFIVAKLTGFQQSDCGACLQLSIRLALEAGIDPDIVKGAVLGTPALPPHLDEVQRFVRSLDTYGPETIELRDSLREKYGETALIDIAMVVTSTQIFPRIKRALGYFDSCQRMKFEF